MMLQKRTLSYVFATLISLSSMAQGTSRSGELVAEESDSIQLFRGASISYDVAGTVMRMVSDYGQFEGAVHFNLRDRYFPVAEIGIGDANHETDPVTGIAAKVRAPYMRLGCDFNISRNKHDTYRVLVGLRYAFTSFKTEASGSITDSRWGGVAAYDVETPDCFFHWAELLFAVDAKLWGPVRMGWSVRYRRKLGSGDIGANSLWYIPGYGKSGNVIGATFNVGVELWRKNK